MQDKIRVAFFFSDTLVGGAETNILKISEELRKYNYEIHFIVLENNGPLLKGKEHIYDSLTIIGRYEQNLFSSVKKYYQLIIRLKLDYISCFGLRVDIFARILTKLINSEIKIIGNIRASESWRKSYHVLLDRITSGLVYKWVSNSNAGREIFIKREKIKPEKIEVIYNYIEFNENNKIKLEPKINLLRIGVLANYKKSKGHYNLPLLSSLLTEMDINHVFICAGNDYTAGKFDELIRRNNLKNQFSLLGYISDKQDFFNNIDVLLLPSYMEGLPTSIIEAMSFGVPIIASNVDGNKEVISNEHNGYTTDPDNLKEFAVFLSLIKDFQIRTKFVKSGFDILHEKFTKQKNIEKWKLVFH